MEYGAKRLHLRRWARGCLSEVSDSVAVSVCYGMPHVDKPEYTQQASPLVVIADGQLPLPQVEAAVHAIQQPKIQPNQPPRTARVLRPKSKARAAQRARAPQTKSEARPPRRALAPPAEVRSPPSAHPVWPLYGVQLRLAPSSSSG